MAEQKITGAAVGLVEAVDALTAAIADTNAVFAARVAAVESAAAALEAEEATEKGALTAAIATLATLHSSEAGVLALGHAERALSRAEMKVKAVAERAEIARTTLTLARALTLRYVVPPDVLRTLQTDLRSTLTRSDGSRWGNE